ncbi:MAG TPA: Lrp/AsnC family transcriptional regulator [Dongiaceae bacterium]|nr:Lrp/AsnC family transcriptional regulator [Dongiaceae bacterium]
MKQPEAGLDDIDRKMLRALQDDGRIAVVQLAEMVGLSVTPCLRRLKRLEADGIIRGYRADLDPKRAGCALQAFIEVRLSDHAEATVARFEQMISQRSEVVACYAMTGDTDFLLHVMTSDLDALSDFATKSLLRMPGVRESHSSIVFSVIKEKTGIPLGAAR